MSRFRQLPTQFAPVQSLESGATTLKASELTLLRMRGLFSLSSAPNCSLPYHVPG